MKTTYIAPIVGVNTISLCTVLCASGGEDPLAPMPVLPFGGKGSDYQTAD